MQTPDWVEPLPTSQFDNLYSLVIIGRLFFVEGFMNAFNRPLGEAIISCLIATVLPLNGWRKMAYFDTAACLVNNLPFTILPSFLAR